MPKLSQLKASKVIKVLERLGFILRGQTGSHAVYTHTDGRQTTIPIHPTKTLGIGLLTKIIKKDLEMTTKEFVSLL